MIHGTIFTFHQLNAKVLRYFTLKELSAELFRKKNMVMNINNTLQSYLLVKSILGIIKHEINFSYTLNFF